MRTAKPARMASAMDGASNPVAFDIQSVSRWAPACAGTTSRFPGPQGAREVQA
jgi:hypothetical protein